MSSDITSKKKNTLLSAHRIGLVLIPLLFAVFLLLTTTPKISLSLRIAGYLLFGLLFLSLLVSFLHLQKRTHDKARELTLFAEGSLEAQRRALAERMQEALYKKEFVVYLQPKYDLGQKKVTGAEALVRWADPLRGIVPPAEFIPIMEETGFIEVLDLFVFESACRILRGWMDRGLQPVCISVNLSRIHLGKVDFADTLAEIAGRYEIPSGLLETEFTEATVLSDTEAMQRTLEALHAAGMTVAMDGFGMGRSSLPILQRYCPDVIKLSRAFFKDGCETDRARTVLNCMISLAKGLGATVVAEGVENHKTMEYLATTACDMVQGFFISEPIPVTGFEVRFMS